MERRSAIKLTAALIGTTLSASTMAAFISGCQIDESSAWSPVFFSSDQIQFIRSFSETMLPKTHTPGANEAKVDRYLDTIRPLRFTSEENEAFKTELNALMERAHHDLGKSFHEVTEERRLEWLQNIDRSSYEFLQTHPEIKPIEKPFYLRLKEQILVAYFSSEVVAKEYFAYDPVPGKYIGCMPYREVGKAWAF